MNNFNEPVIGYQCVCAIEHEFETVKLRKTKQKVYIIALVTILCRFRMQ